MFLLGREWGSSKVGLPTINDGEGVQGTRRKLSYQNGRGLDYFARSFVGMQQLKY